MILDKHAQNFIDAIRLNDFSMVNCSIKLGTHIATVDQMGIISFRSGEILYWDIFKKGFIDIAINDKYIINTYHNE